MSAEQVEAETDKLMALADTNGDGVVDFDEFAAWFTPMARAVQEFKHKQDKTSKQKRAQKAQNRQATQGDAAKP
jgi:hypothetical protein